MFLILSLSLALLTRQVSCSPSRSNLFSRASTVKTTQCNGKSYVYEELAGYGYIPSNARDKYGDTIGGIGSSIAMDSSSWQKNGDSYTGTLYALPDRGWNTEGTLNYQNRVHVIEVSLTRNESATVSNPSPPNIALTYQDTITLTDPDGTPVTGLDPNTKDNYLSFSSIPFDLPSVKYEGNGYGGSGPGGFRVSLDSEGIFLGSDGSFWISDEYGSCVPDH